MSKPATIAIPMSDEHRHRIEFAVTNERKRLLGFIRKRVSTDEDAEDILQDVFYQLTASYNVIEPIEQIASWLFKVAGNKVTDWYRKRKTVSMENRNMSSKGDAGEDDIYLNWTSLIPDPDGTPESQYARSAVWSELEEALEELPEEQREAFVLHELEGISFNAMAD
ncbi:MAG: sigma-70 family RNA polymerase sigma factor, partial [Bacteroidota bacterium]|nr:sigma-70 family RNA polymerase sigma factor [Bacteroidota bacterium]